MEYGVERDYLPYPGPFFLYKGYSYYITLYGKERGEHPLNNKYEKDVMQF